MLVLAAAFGLSALAQPAIGALIDREYIFLPVFLSVFGNAFGVISLFGHSIWVVICGVSLFLISAGAIQTVTSHLVEGLAPDGQIRAMASKNYIMGNIGFAISATLTFFFEEPSLSIAWFGHRFDLILLYRPLVGIPAARTQGSQAHQKV
ncbi:hypothetical protein WDW37_04685 [Bdellovibrionota bacterium FG-1]